MRVPGFPLQRADTGEAKPHRGLVKAAYLAAYDDGRAVQLVLPGVAPIHTAKRGECDGMSDDSKRRLLALMHTLRRDAARPVLVTLTFPAEIRLSAQEAKKCLLAWFKRQAREFENWCAIWRLEAHPELSRELGRMHPHFHLLTWGAWYDLAEVSRTWTEVVWSVLGIDPCLTDAEGVLVKEKHQEAGTRCERVRSWAGVAYCVKAYIGKDEEFPLGKAGRVWGWHAFELLPVAPVRHVPLTPRQVCLVQKRVREWMAGRGLHGEYALRTLFDEDPSGLAARLLAQESANETKWLARQWSWRGGPIIET